MLNKLQKLSRKVKILKKIEQKLEEIVKKTKKRLKFSKQREGGDD